MKAGGRPDLRRILIAYTVNELGTWFGYIALAVAVYDHTHSALEIAGLFICARCVPALLVPAVVARVEASERRGELSGLYLVEAAATVALAILLWHFWMPAVLFLAVVDGSAALAANALLRAAAARAGAAGAVKGGEPSQAERAAGERRANAALNVAFSATVAIGPAIAGVMVAAAGASSALFVDAATFVACGVLLLDLRPHIEELASESIPARIAAVWHYVRTVPQLGSLLLAEAFGLVFFTATAPIEVLYAKATLGAGDAGFGAIAAVWGVGMVAGSLFFSRSVNKSLGPLLIMGTAAVGLAYVGFSVAPTLPFALAVAVIGGAGNGVQWAALISSVQRLATPSLQGQMMGLIEAMGSLCPAIGFSLGATVATLASPRFAYFFAGAAAIAVTGIFARLFRGDSPARQDSPIAPAALSIPDPERVAVLLDDPPPEIGQTSRLRSKAPSRIGR